MEVELSKTAVKQLKKAPVHVLRKFEGWVRRIEDVGMAATRQVPGYHDEPLLGKLRGKRSVRLSKQWRAIYSIKGDKMEIVFLEEVTPHEYKK